MQGTLERKVNLKSNNNRVAMDLRNLTLWLVIIAHIDAFYKALTDNDGFARNHINESVKYADYLSNDVESAVIKEEKVTGINEIYAGGVPVLKMQQTQTIHETTTNVLPGTIRTSRFGTTTIEG